MKKVKEWRKKARNNAKVQARHFFNLTGLDLVALSSHPVALARHREVITSLTLEERLKHSKPLPPHTPPPSRKPMADDPSNTGHTTGSDSPISAQERLSRGIIVESQYMRMSDMSQTVTVSGATAQASTVDPNASTVEGSGYQGTDELTDPALSGAIETTAEDVNPAIMDQSQGTDITGMSTFLEDTAKEAREQEALMRDPEEANTLLFQYSNQAVMTLPTTIQVLRNPNFRGTITL